jgi:lycopene cyclase domain-containing protein
VTMDHWQYLLVLAACLVITAPLEFLGEGVYRQARRTAAAVLPVAMVFVVWDVIAVAAHIWSYNPRYVTGLKLPGGLPVEELLFFVVIPLCGLLTYNAVSGILARLRRVRTEAAPRS